MPMLAVQLKPGVDTQQTPTLNSAGIYQSQLIRYKDGLVQSYGGCQPFIGTSIPSTVRSLHAWLDSDNESWLSAAATNNLIVMHAGNIYDITPQTRLSSFAPDFSISTSPGNEYNITVADPNSGVSIYDTVYFNTPVSIGNLLVNGAYTVAAVLSTGSYIITSSVAATTSITSSGVLPTFTSSDGSGIVSVALANNNFLSIPGLYYNLIAPTSVGGLTIQGKYLISSVVTSTNFTITAPSQASSNQTASMNAGLVQANYYIALGPQVTATGFGAGGFGAGGFGTGTATTGVAGAPITATDWSQENWGEILLANPKGGAIYSWSDNSGLQKAQVVSQAPFFNNGIFVSQPQQILVAWGSVQSTGAVDQLMVRWSDAGNYNNWTVSNQTAAGSFHIPTGSYIIGGMQCPTYGLISTDIDVWVMQYVGGTVIFNFTRVGTGCGWIGPHAAGTLAGTTYWCGINNFYMLGSSGVVPMPCTVWDQIFQNLNTAYQTKIVCAINSAFNEITWFYPSAASTGENDSYVKVHIQGQEYEWDYGMLPRTAWSDVSVLGMPVASDTTGAIFQQETGTATAGVPYPSFRSGWWAISEGEDLSFVDWILPDFQWGLKSGAQDAKLSLTFYSLDYPGDTPKVYGPFTVTQATEYLNVRIRGRLMSVMVQSVNSEFWRLGRIRYRAAQAGRR